MTKESGKQTIASVALDPVTEIALEQLMAESGHTKSEIIRECILIGYYLGASTDFLLLGKKANELATGKHTPRTKLKMTPEERTVIDTYKQVYNYKKRIYYPPVMLCLRNAAKTLDYETIRNIIEVSPNHPLIAMDLGNGKTPNLQMILADKMLGQLLPLAEQIKEDEYTRTKMELEGTIKPLAINDLMGTLNDNDFSVAYDLIQEAQSSEEVAKIRKMATENTLDKLFTELADEVR